MSDDMHDFSGLEKPDSRAEDWLQFLCLNLFDSHLDEKTASVLFNHLLDIEIASISSSFDTEEKSADLKNEILEKIIKSSSQRPYLNIFFKDSPGAGAEELLSFFNEGTGESRGRKHLFSRKKNNSNQKLTSDLSNVQIVKKMESQLKPFLEMEKILIPQFLGKRVNKEEAQLLFNFIMSKLKEKVPQREWEQISRRRHK